MFVPSADETRQSTARRNLELLLAALRRLPAGNPLETWMSAARVTHPTSRPDAIFDPSSLPLLRRALLSGEVDGNLPGLLVRAFGGDFAATDWSADEQRRLGNESTDAGPRLHADRARRHRDIVVVAAMANARRNIDSITPGDLIRFVERAARDALDTAPLRWAIEVADAGGMAFLDSSICARLRVAEREPLAEVGVHMAGLASILETTPAVGFSATRSVEPGDIAAANLEALCVLTVVAEPSAVASISRSSAVAFDDRTRAQLAVAAVVATLFVLDPDRVESPAWVGPLTSAIGNADETSISPRATTTLSDSVARTFGALGRSQRRAYVGRAGELTRLAEICNVLDTLYDTTWNWENVGAGQATLLALAEDLAAELPTHFASVAGAAIAHRARFAFDANDIEPCLELAAIVHSRLDGLEGTGDHIGGMEELLEAADSDAFQFDANGTFLSVAEAIEALAFVAGPDGIRRQVITCLNESRDRLASRAVRTTDPELLHALDRIVDENRGDTFVQALGAAAAFACDDIERASLLLVRAGDSGVKALVCQQADLEKENAWRDELDLARQQRITCVAALAEASGKSFFELAKSVAAITQPRSTAPGVDANGTDTGPPRRGSQSPEL